MRLPNLFIVGAQKSGTTSLHRLLDSHSDIFFPKSPQEIHFFDIERNYNKGVEWYSSLFSEWQGQKHIGQTSPLYMYLPHVPKRIHQLAPDAKIIFILRNPIERAYSHYWHEIRYGWEYLSFVDALMAEPERIDKNDVYRRHYSYLDRGHYSRQIEEFKSLFGPENLLILLHDELKSDSSRLLSRCMDFLNLDSSGFTPDKESKGALNRAMRPRSRQLQRIRPLLERYGSERIARILDKVNLASYQYLPLEEDIRKRLQEEFEFEFDYIRATLNEPSIDWS